jgi:hypothetical protein
VIGGILKGIVAKRLAETNKAIAEQGLTIMALKKRVEAGHDPTQNVVTDWFTMHEILEKQRAHPKGRRGLSIKCSARLRRWCHDQKRDGDVRPGKEPARYMFQWDAVRLWLGDEGHALIKAHNDEITGHGVLRLVPQVKHKPPAARRRSQPPKRTNGPETKDLPA